MTSLSRKTLTQFILCVVVLLLLATPLFYLLTKWFFAEDMIDIIEAVNHGQPIPPLDLEEDILEGMALQFCLIALLLAVGIVLTMRFISYRLWKPFDETLRLVRNFRLEDGKLPNFPKTDVTEFDILNRVLAALLQNTLTSYRSQKEFTENASHELQTPLAVFQAKLDLLLQQSDLTERQAEIIQGLYEEANRLSRLSRNLLLLAKIDNRQYERMETINLADFLAKVLPPLRNVAGDMAIKTEMEYKGTPVKANRALLESLVNNLVVNAVRHNRHDGEIVLRLAGSALTISNTSDEPALDETLIFNRFYRPSEKVKGNGLGLAIVKAICDYHGWAVGYRYLDGRHHFTVRFPRQA